MKVLLAYLALILVIVGFVNFFWFLAESQKLGGDALNGYQRNGECFVGSHGFYTHVDCRKWTWSRIHAISVFITHPLAMLGMAYLLMSFLLPALMGARSGVRVQERIRLIESSGQELTSARSGGRIGNVNFSWPLIKVSVYPSGLLIRPIFMSPIAILRSEIQSLQVKRVFLSRGIQIKHSSPDVTSPLLLYLKPGSAPVQALEQVTGLSVSDSE